MNFLEEYGTDDPRLGHIITPGEDGDLVIVGFPFDEGVRRNGGRVGAKLGPSTFRTWLKKVGPIVNPELGIDLRRLKITDSGDVTTQFETQLEEAHSELTDKVFKVMQRGGVPFVIGGGNDQSYPNACAMLSHFAKSKDILGVINIDAHLDVRPKKDNLAHSGSPFRLLLEDERFKGHIFFEFASQGNQCSAEHWQFVLNKPKCKIFSLHYVKHHSAGVTGLFQECLNNLGDHIFVSFDIDAIASSDCPGVSSPANVGLTAQEALDICFLAGHNPKVCLFDLSEFNPMVEDYRTGKLVATMFYYFALGFTHRKP